MGLLGAHLRMLPSSSVSKSSPPLLPTLSPHLHAETPRRSSRLGSRDLAPAPPLDSPALLPFLISWTKRKAFLDSISLGEAAEREGGRRWLSRGRAAEIRDDGELRGGGRVPWRRDGGGRGGRGARLGAPPQRILVARPDPRHGRAVRELRHPAAFRRHAHQAPRPP
jgi:hypothetical protein